MEKTNKMGARGMLAVVAGVIRRAGKYLVYQRPEGKLLAGKWEFPGGKLEEGESPEDALARELMEELGLRVRVGRVLDAIRRQDQGKDVLLLFYECATDDAPETREHGRVRFAEPEDLQGMDFSPMDRLFLSRNRLEDQGVRRAL